jgi:hypothetical protein
MHVEYEVFNSCWYLFRQPTNRWPRPIPPPHDTARGLYLDSTKPRHGSLQCRKIILEIAEEIVHLIQKLANDVYMSTRTFNKAGRGSNSVRQHDQLSSSSSAIGE